MSESSLQPPTITDGKLTRSSLLEFLRQLHNETTAKRHAEQLFGLIVKNACYGTRAAMYLKVTCGTCNRSANELCTKASGNGRNHYTANNGAMHVDAESLKFSGEHFIAAKPRGLGKIIRKDFDLLLDSL